MRDLIRLTRPLNLLIVALTMVVMRYGVIGGWFDTTTAAINRLPRTDPQCSRAASAILPQLDHHFTLIFFILLMLSVILIMAGGNVINDYFDTRIDRVNKPNDVIVGRSVKRRVAMIGHWALSGVGLIIGAIVAWRSGHLKLAVFPVFAVGALWFYSTTFKREMLIGNGLVATLSALVPLLVGLYELPPLDRIREMTTLSYCFPAFWWGSDPLWWWIIGYSAFAFISTLLRELQKDMADVRGDAAAGCRTVPIVWGMQASRRLVAFWAILIIVAVGLLADQVFTEIASRAYLYVLVIAPILASCILTWNARTRDQHYRAGNVMKLAMVFAVGFGAVYPWLIA